MSSSNKHWPSMFKSKPCTTHHHHHQLQHDINPSSLLSSGCHRSPYSSVPGSEERTPEPKPRWNPKPEQIRILESIFNSGMVNPPRDEIRRIRCQLQEFGQVGDANVFYWFQNRKSRSKHKHQRHLQTSAITSNKHQQKSTTTTTSAGTTATAPSPSTSSSEKSSPTKSVNNIYFFNSTPPQVLPEPFCFPSTTAAVFSQGFGFPPELSGGVLNLGQGGDQTDESWSGMLLSELMTKKVEEERMNYTRVSTATPPASAASTATSCATDQLFPNTTTVSVPSTINHILGTGVGYSEAVGPDKSTVFINDVAFEVAVGPLNVHEAFGHDAVLVYSSGHPVLTNEWGVTLQPLQHGGFYYLVRTLTPISTTASESTTHMVTSSKSEVELTVPRSIKHWSVASFGRF